MSRDKERASASQIKKDFIKNWPLDRLEQLEIENFVSNGHRDGFCYDIEFKTPGIGSIKGGSSIKFGLYRKKDGAKEVKLKNVFENEEYVWSKSLGADCESAFAKVREKLLEIANAAKSGDLEAIDAVDVPFFWPVFKWKIAFMYAPEGTLVDIFSKKRLSAYSNNVLEAHEKIMSSYDHKKQTIWQYGADVWEALKDDGGASLDEAEIDDSEGEDDITVALNQILYGPPGTGKTYHTINKAIEIIEGPEIGEDEKRKDLKDRFDKYVKSGQIVFTTFHQSYGYEEFIEGIKPNLDSDSTAMEYQVEPGIFKKICEAARANIEKTQLKTDEELTKEKEFYSKLETLKDKIENGIDKEEMFYINNTAFIYQIDEDAFRYTGESWGNTQRMKYSDLLEFYKNNVKERKDIKILDSVSGLAKQHATYYFNLYKKLLETEAEQLVKTESEQLKNYVFIIDEINRGNISKIFGELITLIEESKRLGKDESTTVTLPYSKEEFGVPNNVHIIGTMNTADRSIALMDTALRRRFEFVEMMPKPELLKGENGDGIVAGSINLKTLLTTINERIEYLYDRDHQIGHSYLMDVETKEQLDAAFRTKIIPLLQEYFYDDWEKIQIVLGDHTQQNSQPVDCFILAKKLNDKRVLGFTYDDIADEVVTYSVNEKFTTNAYLKLCKPSETDGQ